MSARDPDRVSGASPRVRGRPRQEKVLAETPRSIPAGAGPTSGCRRPGPTSWEHPRGCGADAESAASACCKSGASPRVRGRRRGRCPQSSGRRSIPAGAGPTTSSAPSPPPPAEHPRGCGADSMKPGVSMKSRGASPRVRGRRHHSREEDHAGRSIPAGAGPTPLVAATKMPPQEHPRGCGADFMAVPTTSARQGASPRVRGRPGRGGGRLLAGGSIPAGAGPTPPFARRLGPSVEHPRGCGADLVSEYKDIAERGASPRVRGRRCARSRGQPGCGSIPAGAGPTRHPRWRAVGGREHPRGCGADPVPPAMRKCWAGASPRVRGRRTVAVRFPWTWRSIPAGAGPTIRRGRRRRRAREHPRGCGADPSDLGGIAPGLGASPRVRGRLALVHHHQDQGGSIPAGAGPTRPELGFGTTLLEHPRGCGADQRATARTTP